MRDPRLLIIGLVLTGSFLIASTGAMAQSPQPPESHLGEWEINKVVDWQSGFVDDLIISNNINGELRLDAEQVDGRFISRPFEAPFDLNAAGAFWRAEMVEDAELLLELRGRSSPPDPELNSFEEADDEKGWGPWQPLYDFGAYSRAEDGAFATPYVVAFPPDTRYLQFRATFSSSFRHASVELQEITIAFLNTMDGPSVAAGLPKVPIIFGPPTLTPRPMIIERTTWSGKRRAAAHTHAIPRGIIIHDIQGVVPPIDKTPSVLRALANFQTEVLDWQDMSYHYLIDQEGLLYEGRLGGPTSGVPHLAVGDKAIHVALIHSRNEEPSVAANDTLTDLLAWLSEAYQIAPRASHRVIVDGEYVSRPNIVAHRQILEEEAALAMEQESELDESLPLVRTSTDITRSRSRWFFPEGNVRDYRERLIVFNPGDEIANTQVILFHNTLNSSLVRDMTIPGGGHTELLVNDIISDTDSISAIVDADRQIIAESSMELPTDISAKPGNPDLSRIFYFPEGSTADTFRTYLVLFNPHEVPNDATLTYMKGDGTQANQHVLIPPNQRVVVTINDVLPDVGFGTRVIATRPIAAMRTMRFGYDESGMHIDPGITRLSRTWYFAEGTTNPPFRMRLLVLNPNPETSNTTITFMTPDGTSLKRNYAIPPTTRLVVDVNEVVPTLGVATVIEADRLLAAERALYFDPQTLAQTSLVTPTATSSLTLTRTMTSTERVPIAGTVSSGATEPAYKWYFSYGSTQDMRQYLLISNPGRSQARVTIDFFLGDEIPETQSVVMPAGSRYTLAVHDFYPHEPLVSATVRSTQPIVAERSLFAMDVTGGGSTSLGVPQR